MPWPLLLDEMFSGSIAEQLCAKGHDVRAVVTDSALAGLPDDRILAHATASKRALVTANIKDFMPLDARYRAASQIHAGLILVSTKSFPQNRVFVPAITNALSAFLNQPGQAQPGQVHFLARKHGDRSTYPGLGAQGVSKSTVSAAEWDLWPVTTMNQTGSWVYRCGLVHVPGRTKNRSG